MTPRGKKKLLQAGNILAVLITILVNALAVLLPLNDKTTQELSDTFSIWSIIYILWIVFAVYQARDLLKKDEIEMPFLHQITFLFILSSVANSAWIFLWHYEYIGLSVLMMIILLFSLLAIYLRLNIGRSPVTTAEKLCVHVPFSVYLGWITVATIANITAFLVSVEWNGFGIDELLWTIIIIAVGTLLTCLILALRKDKRMTQPNTTTDMNVAIAISIALVLIMACLLAVLGYSLMRSKKRELAPRI